MKLSETVDVEEDEILTGWAIAPTEACTFVALAVFVEKRDAEVFLAILRKAKKRNTYDDLAIVPARAVIACANTHDVRAGRKALHWWTR